MDRTCRLLAAVALTGLVPVGVACKPPPPKPTPFTYATAGCSFTVDTGDNPVTGQVSVRPSPATDGGTVTISLTDLALTTKFSWLPTAETMYELPLPAAVTAVPTVTGANLRGFRVEDRVLKFWFRNWEPNAPVAVDITAQLGTGIAPTEVVWPAPANVHVFAVSPDTGAPYLFDCRIDPANPPLTRFSVR